jgi:hypothetical protein
MVAIGFDARAVLAPRIGPVQSDWPDFAGIAVHRQNATRLRVGALRSTELGSLSQTAACGNLWTFPARFEPIALRAKELTTLT